MGSLYLLHHTQKYNALQMKGRWESIYVFPKMKLLFPKHNYNIMSPSSYAHLSVWDLYISRIGLPILLQGNMWTDPGNIYRSQSHECVNWDWGHAIPRKGIHKWHLPCSAAASQWKCSESLVVFISLWNYKTNNLRRKEEKVNIRNFATFPLFPNQMFPNYLFLSIPF